MEIRESLFAARAKTFRYLGFYIPQPGLYFLSFYVGLAVHLFGSCAAFLLMFFLLLYSIQFFFKFFCFRFAGIMLRMTVRAIEVLMIFSVSSVQFGWHCEWNTTIAAVN